MKSIDYKIDYWKGIKLYRCEYCFFDTFHYAKMNQHYDEKHRIKRKPVKMKTTIYDRFGNPIKYR